MESDNLLKRVHDLELELHDLKTQLKPNDQRQTALLVKKSITFVLTYWTLLSFVVAIAVAVYIKYAFGVDYFESYRATATSRNISEFHRRLGDRMLLSQEWAAAEDAFGKALQANSNNTAASFGLLKARVFKPQAGEKYSFPETQDAMLRYLREQLPDDAVLDLLQAVRYWDQSQGDAARKALLAALKKTPDLAAAQIMLSHIELTDGDLDAAAKWSAAAVKSEPENSLALNNLGFLRLLQEQFDEAHSLLERGYRLAPGLLTPLVMSDCLRMQGKYADALLYSRTARDMSTDENVKETRLVGGEWVYNHLPLTKGDRESWKTFIYVTTLKRKQALAQFAFALDSALNGDLKNADAAWTSAKDLDSSDNLRAYFANKIAATLAFAPDLKSSAKAEWLNSALHELNPNSDIP